MTAPLEPDEADLIAAAVLAVPGVAGLHSGLFGEAVTLLPGRRIEGVVVGHESCAVHITVRCPGDPDSVVHAVQETLARVVRIPVVVTVEDFAVE
ncbi:hypothetical protein HQ325_14070 [Rhodococcus sp. BP-349]|jgi:hypothetical protein|uniref:hypothetical protein n=1 Tax=unclassified Rhodococcus (in: high G+C Gram-positive bacteria) TaxID=192944 RepID=UPI000485C611|nr:MULTISPECIES: hypothetical protein [unclassified Rhodococcus (in: high G+C Gram-positive bacteria)]KQU36371.1 hypothetical protein ASG69_19210 [Rhodococcus sp. Leaf225]KQU48918.1 hypothetical protein ASH03_03675 [Rhodococcus sp. Leaf258]MBY6539801.1 hypothetical protein [Rhodococcus sp. BP-363]MBY6543871.1 hypothetical protein [Rhodococcus sp. BP-369]MBY6563101.1 hypothetical protein [Rhodococcus sp. BP-370]